MLGAYNEGEHLHDTLPTILGQSVGDVRFIFTDNGSTDETGEILRDYAAADPRISLFSNPTNLRPPLAMNLGWQRALSVAPNADWYLTHGADDRMLEGYLQAILDVAAQNPSANTIFSPWHYINDLRPSKRFPRFDPETCHETHQMPAWKAITRELWERVGEEDERVEIASDWDWIVRARYELRPVQLDRPYVSLRVRTGGRITQSEEVVWRDLYRHLCRITGKPIAGWAC